MPLQGHAAGSGKLTYAHQPHHEAHAHGHAMLLNPAIPYTQPYSSPDQQGLLAHDSPLLHYTMSMQPPTTSMDASNTQRLHRLISSSEDEVDTYNNSNKGWQLIRRTKREKVQRTPINTPDTATETRNRYELLSQETNQENTDVNQRPPQHHRPLAIFVHGVIKYCEMIKRICDIAEDEQYCTKSWANNVYQTKLHNAGNI